MICKRTKKIDNIVQSFVETCSSGWRGARGQKGGGEGLWSHALLKQCIWKYPDPGICGDISCLLALRGELFGMP